MDHFLLFCPAHRVAHQAMVSAGGHNTTIHWTPTAFVSVHGPAGCLTLLRLETHSYILYHMAQRRINTDGGEKKTTHDSTGNCMSNRFQMGLITVDASFSVLSKSWIDNFKDCILFLNAGQTVSVT